MSSVDDEMQMCPVCGHDLKIVENDDGRYIVTCFYCGFEHGPFESYEEAFEVWKKKKQTSK